MGGSSADSFVNQIASDDPNELFRKLVIILKALHWDIIFPNSETDDDDVKGLIVGTLEYVNEISGILDNSNQ
jgi:hypothetical protein